MKKLLTSLTLLVILCLQVHAQYDLQAEQRFNRKLPKRPLIGFELWRSYFPLIILQEPRNGTPQWKNLYKWVTTPSGIDAYYNELGEYDYDTTQQSWVVNRVDVYNLNYDFTQKRVISATVDKRYQNTSSNSTMQINYAFNGQFLPDTEFVQRKVGSGNYTPYSNYIFTYDTNNRIKAISYHYLASGFWFKTFYSYDGDNRLKGETTIVGNTPTSTPDSSSKIIYEYDSSGRLSSFRTEVYEIVGSPYNWTTTNKTGYFYEGSSNTIIKNVKWTYDASDNYDLKISDEYEYTYNLQGYPETMIQSAYQTDATLLARSKWVLSYLNNEPDYAYEYEWSGIGYKPNPSFRYLFKETNTGLINEVATEENAVLVYPNPVKDKLYLNYRELPTTVQLIDVTGKMRELEINSYNQSVDMGVLPSGIYVLMVKGRGIKIYKD